MDNNASNKIKCVSVKINSKTGCTLHFCDKNENILSCLCSISRCVISDYCLLRWLSGVDCKSFICTVSEYINLPTKTFLIRSKESRIPIYSQAL